MTRDILAERAAIDAKIEGMTLCSAFERTAAAHPDLDAFRWRVGDNAYDSFTWSRYRERVRDATLGFMGLGLKPGDFALIQARCIPEHSVADLGIVHARATPVSLYNTLSPEQICYIANHCEARIAIVEDIGFYERFLKVRDELPHLEKIVLIKGADEAASDWVVSWDEVMAAGREEAARNPGAFDESWKQVKPRDLATLIYTSGTTGPPKAVMDTHRNIIWHFESVASLYEFYPDDHGLSYLPLAHAAGRTGAHWNPLLFGGTVVAVPEITDLLLALIENRPTLFVGVPRVYEKLYAGMQAALVAQPDENLRKMVLDAVDVGREIVAHEQKGVDVPDELQARYDSVKPILEAVRGRVGLDRVRVALVGAAPIATEVIEFFHALGVRISEVWGMSELTAVATANGDERIKIGSVGFAIPGVEVKLADDGELLARGGNLMKGYYKDPEKTAEAIDDDGWMHTGDIGSVDEEGYFRVIDRKKELIITAGGKNISPANLENALKQHPLVGQACIIGDRRAYLTALVVLDGEVAPVWAKSNGIESPTIAELSREPALVAEVQKAVDAANEQVSRVENIRRFVILPAEWTAESDELTPTLKLKRRVINSKYADEIESLYSG
ncbi:MAG: AMP-dependent synthetase/ligase, partial [Actinomycetota bacterium]